MNKPLIVLFGALALGTALPSFAGPDWFVIEQGRKAKQTEQSTPQDATRTAKAQCTLTALALPLDHGPRAQTTPHENRLREQDLARTCA